MRVLVCGGRDFADMGLFSRAMIEVGNSRGPITSIIAGGARGADTMAKHLAHAWNVPFRMFKADWAAHGKAAGPIRNQRMIDEGKPDLVVAFPGGRGTADMVRRARQSGVPVMEMK